ncbi:MAG: hypothetical protein MR328_03220 [Firmicutes bacterium]|nr:hypothetical protein [Bacillota bacterium]
MRKIAAALQALVLVLVMSTAAFSANLDTAPGTQDIDVHAKYVDGVSAPDKLSVDIVWGAMEFTYSVSGSRIWDPATHTYIIRTQPSWAASGNDITVTNHSNVGITASVAFEALDLYNTVNGQLSADSITLPSAENKAVDAAELTGTTTLTLAGTLTDTVTVMTRVGSVTVSIAKSH